MKRRLAHIAIGVTIFLGLYISSLYSYLLFHSLVELFSIVIACGVFMVAWNARPFVDNRYILFIGIAYFFVAGVDLVHTLSYRGMPIFRGYDTNLPTQLWIAARYMESLSLLIAPAFLRRNLRPRLVLIVYGAVFTLLLLSIFTPGMFPACYIEGRGLTPFKKMSEYGICLILLMAMGFLLRHRKEFERTVLRWVSASIVMTIGSELAFTFYVDAYGLSNLVGHYLKILSFYCVYRALIETALTRPYDVLFRNLKQSEEALEKIKGELEIRVRNRTAELAKANEALRQLSAKLLSAHETERKRIAGEIHDSLGSCLSAIRFKVEEALRGGSKTEGGGLTEPLKVVLPVIQEGIEECRRIQTDLRPSILDDLGILATVSWLCRRFESIYSNIHVEHQIEVREEDVPEHLKIVLFRIAQEALNNIAKHGKANQVQLAFSKTDEKLQLKIRDNGQGFDLEKVFSTESSKKGMGLSSMRERTEISGGTFEIQSVHGKGTSILASWPCAEYSSPSLSQQ